MVMGRVIFTVACAVFSFAGVAYASPLPNGGVTADEIAAVLKTKGLVAEIGKDSEGDPVITTSVDEVNFWIYFYGCKAGRCTSIQFSKGYDLDKGLSFEQANEWNYEFRFGKMSMDNEKDPYVKMDLNVEKGATTELIDDNLDLWFAVLYACGEFLDKAEKQVRT